MIINILILVVGFILLIKGADIFVDGASNLALNLHVSKILIALTIVAFGTSAPELAVSLKGIISNTSDIVIGNVIGSNIINILLVLGISSLFRKIKISNNTRLFEIPFLLIYTLEFMILISDGIISKCDSILILLMFLIFIIYLVFISRKKSLYESPEFGIIKSILFIFVGLISLIYGSNIVVDSSVIIASTLNVSQRIISLTIVAFGTSLPELITSITASIKKESDIALGNIIGSNIFNIGAVIGLPSLIKSINCTFNIIDVLVMLLSVITLCVIKKLNYKNGIIMIIIFIVYYSYVIGGI